MQEAAMMQTRSGIIAAAADAPIVARFDFPLLRIFSPIAHNCLAISITWSLYLVGTDALSLMQRTSSATFVMQCLMVT